MTILGERSQRGGEVELDQLELSQAFNDAASRYDLMVALNPSYHAHLRAAAGALVEWLPRPKIASSVHPEPVEGRQSHLHLLDLGCGSGASTRAVQQAVEAAGGGG